MNPDQSDLGSYCLQLELCLLFMPPLLVECGRALSVAHVRASVRPSVRPLFR